MKKRTAVFGWTKLFQRTESNIKASVARLNVHDPKDAEKIKQAAELQSNLNQLHRKRVKMLRGEA
ncbi:hypothetical protein [Dyella jiangningensis]